MKKITFFVACMLLALGQAHAQFGCDQAVPITDGFTQTGITTPGNAGPEDWVTSVTGTTASQFYWDDDVYLFQYTAGGADEEISMTIFTYNSWNGIGIFTDCSGTALSGRLADAGNSAGNISKTVTAVVSAGQTVYIAVGQWGAPNALNFDVTSFSAVPVDAPPTCPQLVTPADGATDAVLSGVLTWSAASPAVTSYVLSVGTTPGGTDIVAGQDVGTALTYDIPGILNAETTYYVSIIANNAAGSSSGCTEYSFTTAPPLDGDFCQNAIDLNALTSPYSGTTTGALNDNLEYCINGGGTGTNTAADLYFMVTVPAGSTLTIGQTVNGYDSTNIAFYGDCDNRTQIACFDDSDTTTTVWNNDTGSDQTVYWIQDGYNAGNGTFTLAWSVVACANPAATYTVVSDCDGSGGFLVNVDVTDIGSATSLTASDDQNSQTQSVTAPGQFVFGPYTNGTNVVISLANDQDSNCTITSSALTQAVCPPDCSQATVIAACGDLTTVTLNGAGAWNVNTCGFTTPGLEAVYSFTPAESGVYTFTITASTGGYIDYYWKEATGTCDNTGWTCIGDATGPETNPIGNLQAGVTYLILADSEGTTSRTATFKVDCPLLPAENDECDTAITLTVNDDFSCAVVTPGTLTGATGSNVPDNGAGTPDDDVWFSFVATSTTHTVSLLNVTGTPTDLVHEVMSGDCSGLTSLLISDPNNSTLTNLVPGSTYYVRVFSFATGGVPTTSFNVCIGTPPPPPANDECDGAISLTVNEDFNCGVVTPGTLASATGSPVSDNGAGNPDDDVWFSFVATATSHRISILNVTGTPTDLVHEVMSGDCSGLTSVLVSDPNTSNPSGLVPGQTYYVRVFSFATGGVSTTAFNLCVGTPPPPPANDDCGGAIMLTPGGDFAAGAVESTTGGATGTTGVPAPGCGSYLGGDVWYSVTVPASGSLTVQTGPAQGVTTFDSAIAIYSGECGNMTLVSCDDDGAPTDAFSILTVANRTPGEVLYIRIWEYSNDNIAPFSISAFDASLSTSGFDVDGFRAYPNPVTSVLNLQYSKNISNVAVFNLLGQQVLAKSVSATATQLDMTSLSAGTYLVKVTVDGSVKTIKVVKQ